MSDNNYTRRIVESPLFERVSGFHFADADADGYCGQGVVVPWGGKLYNAFLLGGFPESGELRPDDWTSRRLDCDHPATQALLIYMLSKHCAWAKLDGGAVWIGYEVYGLPHPLTRRFQAETLADTFAQAFAYVEGLL